MAEVIWVWFTDAQIEQLLRKDSLSLLKNHKPIDPLVVSITKRKKLFGIKGNVNWIKEQFPLTLCYSITAHKSQGRTLNEVIIDFPEIRQVLFLKRDNILEFVSEHPICWRQETAVGAASQSWGWPECLETPSSRPGAPPAVATKDPDGPCKQEKEIWTTPGG